MLDILVVRIPALVRHLAAGWSEDALLSGRVATLGRESLSLPLPDTATLLDLGLALEDSSWGVALADQALRRHGRLLLPSDKASKHLLLSDVGLRPGRTERLLLSAGMPEAAAGPATPTGGLATAVRSPTQVVLESPEEAKPQQRLVLRAPAPVEQEPAPTTEPTVSLQPAQPPLQQPVVSGNKLGGGSEERELSREERRAKVAAAAASRAAAAALSKPD